jgi:flagellar assembly protein FliH
MTMFERALEILPAPCDAFRVTTYPTTVAPASPIDDPYQRGFDDGEAHAAALFEADRAHCSALLAKANALQTESSDELAVLIAHTVAALVTTLTGRAQIDPTWLAAKAREAADLVADCDAARTLRLHPDDAKLIEEAAIGLTIRPDPMIARGSLRIDGSAGWIEHGRALYLDVLRHQLEMTS